MELIKGVPLTDFCDQNQLTPRQRLELFVPVCRAVQHAHQKGVIHRDLKPSNVLVARHDTTPVVKVIDFGVAKALGQNLTDKTLFTGIAQMIGTPLYMSPEQAGMSDLDIDTRSDIYSLGVLLYELLTGTTPFPKERFKQAGYDEIRRIIREEEPPRPSTRLSESKDTLPAISARRQMEPARLTKLVRGELDWIVMKALEKDRNRRYDTATGLVQDVQRYLADEPVLACPPSAWYRLRKAARRNRARLATAGLMLFFLVLLGSGLGWVAWDQAAKQRETERGATAALAQADAFLAEGLKETDNPARWQAKVGLAEAAVQRAEEVLALGKATANLAGHVRQVREAVREARRDSALLVELERIGLEKAAVKQGHFDQARAASRYAAVLHGYGVDPAAPGEAAARVRRSRISKALLAALEDWWRATPDAAEREQLADVLQAAEPAPDAFRGRWRSAARRRDREALVQMAAEPGVQALPPATLVGLADDLRAVKEYAAAERLLRAGQQRYRGNFWLNHDLGIVLLEQKPPRPEEAVPYLTAALALRSDSPGAYLNLGNALGEKKDLEGAIREYQAALQIDPNYAMAHYNLGKALYDKNDLKGAIREYQAALHIDPNYAPAHNNLGNALRDFRKLDDAIRECQSALDLDPNYAAAHYNLGNALHDKHDLKGAAHEYRAALRIDPKYADAHNNLANTLFDLNDLDGAIREARAALTIDPNHALAHFNLSLALSGKEDLDGAVREARAALKINPNIAMAHNTIGCALIEQGKVDDAIAAFREAVRLEPNSFHARRNLALALRDKGEFRKALEEMHRSHKLDPGVPYPSATWVRECERLAELDAALPGFLAGKTTPANPAERIELAGLCSLKGLHRDAVRFWEQTFTDQPQLARNMRTRYGYHAARAAALAGCRVGKDADQLDDNECARLRRLALSWLRADLEAVRGLLDKKPFGAAFAAKIGPDLQHWLVAADFAGVRGPEALAKLPEAERQPWRELWDDVADLVKRAQGKTTPGK
jgi:serine/threonine-protein kinase